MAGDATHRLLKEFGMAVTDFEDAGTRMREQMQAAQELLPLASDALAASADVNRRWLEVTRFLFEEQARLQAEIARRLAAAGGGPPGR